jgi:hypothetical protein
MTICCPSAIWLCCAVVIVSVEFRIPQIVPSSIYRCTEESRSINSLESNRNVFMGLSHAAPRAPPAGGGRAGGGPPPLVTRLYKNATKLCNISSNSTWNFVNCVWTLLSHDFWQSGIESSIQKGLSHEIFQHFLSRDFLLCASAKQNFC